MCFINLESVLKNCGIYIRNKSSLNEVSQEDLLRLSENRTYRKKPIRKVFQLIESASM